MDYPSVTYDPAADAAYIALCPAEESGNLRTVQATSAGDVMLDIRPDGRLVGIEVLNASIRLPDSILSSALDIPFYDSG